MSIETNVARRQWCAIKSRYPDMIVLMLDGDHYEAYEDGEIVTAVTGQRILPRGDNADTYIAQLTTAGHKVAVCDGVVPANAATGATGHVAASAGRPGAQGADRGRG